MQPSKYQSAVYSHIEKMCISTGLEDFSGEKKHILFGEQGTGERNLIVQAKAGSGKTTTIVEATKRVPYDFNIIFVAFNKHIAESLQKKLPSNAQAATLNSVGWRVCLKNVRGVKLDSKKTELIYQEQFADTKEDRDEFYRTRGKVTRIISLLKAQFITHPDSSDILKISENHDIEGICPELVQMILKCYKECIECKNLMDFDDQIFMPLYHCMDFPRYDLLMIDEAQDLNPVMVDFITKLSSRFVCVGDSHQAIYGFRGADPESMNNFRTRLGAIELPLSICYRCPKLVVLEAQKLVPEIEYSPNARDGNVSVLNLDKFRKKISNSEDYVLCRTTAPLVSECLKAIKDGKKATVKGRDIGQGIAALVRKIAISESQLIEEFDEDLREWHNQQRTRLAKLDKEDQIIVVDDQVDTIRVLSEGEETVAGILKRIDFIFSDLINGGIIFCTVHRSKGLEAPNVFILKPELMPHPAAKKPWQQIQEKNLKYVAITGATENLYYVH